MKHGYNAYAGGCRCAECRQAKADYVRERRAAARLLAQKHTRSADGKRANWANARAAGATRYLAPIERHGTRFGYEEHGCRCFACTDARTSADRRKRSAS